MPPLLPRQLKGFHGSSDPWKRRIVVFPTSWRCWEVMVLLAVFAAEM